MRDDWFKLFSINQFESVLRFSQISIRIRIMISFGNWFLYSYVLYVNDTHEIYFCSANFFQNFFFLGSGSGSWAGSGFHYEIHWRKLFFICLRYPPNLVSLRKVFVKIKILFRIRIRIRIMILLWISIPDLHFIHRRHLPNFVWIR